MNWKVPIYATTELLGTKLRALYQRRKGRDLFDLWQAFGISGEQRASIGEPHTNPYRTSVFSEPLMVSQFLKHPVRLVLCQNVRNPRSLSYSASR